jgi:hypothetical protein
LANVLQSTIPERAFGQNGIIKYLCHWPIRIIFSTNNNISMLSINTAAPDFELNATPDQKFSLSELKECNHSILSRGLESGLRRPDVVVQ